MHHRYRFNGKKGQFRVLTGPNCEQELLDRIQRSIGRLLHAVLVTPVLDNGERLQHQVRPAAGLDHDWVWVDQGPDDAEADPDVGDVLMPDVVLPPAAVQLPLWEYQVVLQFKQPFSKRPRDYALRLLNEDPLHPLVAASTPLTAGTGEDAVEMMLSQHCKAWGAFTLDQGALVLLLHRRHRSLLDEPKVVETIAKHVPLKKVADVQYRQDIISMWKRHFPDEADRLQPRRCDQALRLPLLLPRAPYKVGWDDWMRTNIQRQQPKPDPHVMRPLVLVGAPTLRMTEWARSHGPHLYMRGRLDLPYLHDCLADADGAQYIILDELPWSLLLREEGHSHSILTNSTFSWYHGWQLLTTTQRLPVIVLKSHLPNPDDPCWQPRGWPHWKAILEVTKLLPHVPLLEVAELPTAEAICKEDVGTASVRERTRCPKPLGRPRAQSMRCANFFAAVAETGRKLSVATASSVVVDSGTAPPATVPTTGSADVASPRPRPRTRSQSLPIGRAETASSLKLDFSRRIPHGPDCFLYPDPMPLSHLQRLLHVVAAIEYVQMKYRGHNLARQKDFQSDNVAGSYAFYEYTGSVPDVWHLGEWSTELLELRDALREATGEPVNSMVANQYLDRDACIGDHSDKTPDIKRGTSIWTVSLGATRVCELRKIVDDGSEPLRVELTPGSVFQIGPLTNAAYTHSIPPADHAVEPRYGLTFRTLASRWLHDEQVALRQPAEDGEPWLVQKKATMLDAEGQVVLRQDGYPSRRVVHLPPFPLDDPSHVQEQDIIRLRQVLTATPPRRTKAQKRARQAEPRKKRQRQ